MQMESQMKFYTPQKFSIYGGLLQKCVTQFSKTTEAAWDLF